MSISLSSSTPPVGLIGGGSSRLSSCVDAGVTSDLRMKMDTNPIAIGSRAASTSTDIFVPSDRLAPSFLNTARHPMVCVLHLIWKLLALLCFLLGSFIFGSSSGGGDFIFSFVSTTLFLSLDFWTVKNITGRVLVGMRWWDDIKSDGTSEWIFESAQDISTNTTDRRVFWIGVGGWPIAWLILSINQLLRLDVFWLTLAMVGIVLSSANLVGYWKCSRTGTNDQGRQWNEWAQSAVLGSLIRRAGLSR